MVIPLASWCTHQAARVATNKVKGRRNNSFLTVTPSCPLLDSVSRSTPSQNLRDLKSRLIDVAWARVAVRDIATWAGQRIFGQVFINRKINPKEVRRMWELLEQGIIPNKEFDNLICFFTGAMCVRTQVENMTNKHHVYMTKDGRISLAGLNLAKSKYLAAAIVDSFKNC
eukprot:1194398-Prorocentrum_minimum.AAC.2